MRQWRVPGVLFLGLFLLAATKCAGQTPAGGDPVAVLRDALAAACSQNTAEFAQVLTTRNSEAFGKLTPAARATLLKRFVLLDKPGTPRVESDASGTVTVYCVTAQVSTQMQIGKPELRDNLAYLPLAVKDVTDSADADLHRVIMGMVREHAQWKILSLGLLLLDLPTLGEEWDRAEIKANEQAAIDSLKKLAEAVETYRKTYTHLPEYLAALGQPAKGAAKGDQAGLVEEELVSGRKDGYAFRYVIVGANTSGAPAKYELAAIPVEYGRTGTRSFFRDSAGVLHGADHRGAVGTAMDPKID